MKLFSFISKNFHFPIVILSILLISYLIFDIYKTLKKEEGIKESIEEGISDSFKKGQNERPIEPFSNYEVILKRNVFFLPELQGEAKRSSQAEGGGGSEVKELRLVLKGTIVGINYASMAVIEDMETKREKLYRINETIGDAKIIGIFPEKVVMNRSGKEEILTMFEERKREISHGGKALSERGLSPAKGRDLEPKTIKRDEVREGTSSFQYLMTQLRIKPHFSSGRPEGFMVSDIKPGSIVHKAGIQDGDIIKGINGIKTETPSQLLKVYRELRDVRDLEIEVEREGQKKIISIKVE